MADQTEVRECPIARTLQIVGEKWSLLAIREIGCGLVLAEAQRRFRQEQRAHRNSPRRGEEGQHGARRVPEHGGVAADRFDHRGEVLHLAVGRRTPRVSTRSACAPVPRDGAESAVDESAGEARGVGRDRQCTADDDHGGPVSALLVGDRGAVG